MGNSDRILAETMRDLGLEEEGLEGSKEAPVPYSVKRLGDKASKAKKHQQERQQAKQAQQQPEPNVWPEEPTQPIETPVAPQILPPTNPEQKPQPMQTKTPTTGDKILRGFVNILNSEKIMEKLTGEALSELVIILISKIKK